MSLALGAPRRVFSRRRAILRRVQSRRLFTKTRLVRGDASRRRVVLLHQRANVGAERLGGFRQRRVSRLFEFRASLRRRRRGFRLRRRAAVFVRLCTKELRVRGGFLLVLGEVRAELLDERGEARLRGRAAAAAATRGKRLGETRRRRLGESHRGVVRVRDAARSRAGGDVQRLVHVALAHDRLHHGLRLRLSRLELVQRRLRLRLDSLHLRAVLLLEPRAEILLVRAQRPDHLQLAPVLFLELGDVPEIHQLRRDDRRGVARRGPRRRGRPDRPPLSVDASCRSSCTCRDRSALCASSASARLAACRFSAAALFASASSRRSSTVAFSSLARISACAATARSYSAFCSASIGARTSSSATMPSTVDCSLRRSTHSLRRRGVRRFRVFGVEFRRGEIFASERRRRRVGEVARREARRRRVRTPPRHLPRPRTRAWALRSRSAAPGGRSRSGAPNPPQRRRRGRRSCASRRRAPSPPPPSPGVAPPSRASPPPSPRSGGREAPSGHPPAPTSSPRARPPVSCAARRDAWR